MVSIRRIPCACAASTYMLDKPCTPVLTPQKQPCIRPFTDFSYWPVPVSFNNWNIITLSQKATTSEAFYKIHRVVLDGISDKLASLVQSGKYCSMNIAYTSTMGYYVIKVVLEAYTLQEDTKCNKQIISSGELVVKSQYLSCMQVKTNWYW